MIWSATAATFGQLLLTRMLLGGVTAAAGPLVASLVGDYFGSAERGRIYGYILAGEVAGAGVGFAVTGDIAALSWRAAFVILALPAFALAWMIVRFRFCCDEGFTASAAGGRRRPGHRRAAGCTRARR
jgi:MFS family permease